MSYRPPSFVDSPSGIQAQLDEYFQRSRASVIGSFPAVLTVAWFHWGLLPASRVLGWLGFMLVVQCIRLGCVYKKFGAARGHDIWRTLRQEMLVTALGGLGWGCSLFVLDTAQLDFSVLFKIATLAAVLGVTINSMAVLLPVCASYMLPIAVCLMVYLLGFASFLKGPEVTSLILGCVVYVLLLYGVARHVNRLTLQALAERGAREEVLRELQELNGRLHDMAIHDPLTHIFNRRHLMEGLQREFNTFLRHGQVFSVLLLDVDDFKQINDLHGHQVGDQVLVGLARTLSAELRDIDLFGRWGGEEFLCVLPNEGLDEALACAERLRRMLERSTLVAGLPDLRVSASFGVAVVQQGEDVDGVVRRADGRLYDAKREGKNRVRS